MRHSAKAVARLEKERQAAERRAAKRQQARRQQTGRQQTGRQQAERQQAKRQQAAHQRAEHQPARHQQAGHQGAEGPALAGRAAGSRVSQAIALVPYWIILCGLAGGLVLMHGGERDVRSGTLVTAGVLLAAAAARLMLPERRAGMLGSRRRLADVAAFAALGVGLLVSGLVFPVPV